jgi:hypothetical protein
MGQSLTDTEDREETKARANNYCAYYLTRNIARLNLGKIYLKKLTRQLKNTDSATTTGIVRQTLPERGYFAWK